MVEGIASSRSLDGRAVRGRGEAGGRGRWSIGVPVEEPPVPGRHISDHQKRLFVTLRRHQAIPMRRVGAGLSTATAYRIKGDPRLSRSIPLRAAGADGIL